MLTVLKAGMFKTKIRMPEELIDVWMGHFLLPGEKEWRKEWHDTKSAVSDSSCGALNYCRAEPL